MSTDGSSHRSLVHSLGLYRLGLYSLTTPWLTALLVAVVTGLAVLGVLKLRVDDSLSELFRTNTKEFHEYEEIDRRFPSSEYDVLVVVEGHDLLKRKQLEAFRDVVIDLQLTDGVKGLVSMLSARGKPDATGYAPPVVPDDLPEDPAAYDAVIKALAENDIVKGKFLSEDGALALIVISLDRAAVAEKSARTIITGIDDVVKQDLQGSGLNAKLTGAPVMQLEIRNAVERDQMTYNGLGLLFGATIAGLFFRRLSLMLVAALPPVIAVLWSLGMLGWMGFKLNLFLNVMTPLVMVMGFADSMQIVSAIRIRLREGDNRFQAARFAVQVVGPACVVAHGATLVSFLALLLSDSALLRTFGLAGALAVVISFIVVIAVAAGACGALDPQRAEARSRPFAGRCPDGRPQRLRRRHRRSRHAASGFLFGARLRAVRAVHLWAHAAAAALSPRRSGAGPRAGAGGHWSTRSEAHRRQSGARHDQVEGRHGRVQGRAFALRSRYAGGDRSGP